jgi:amino acid transporter
MLLLGLNLPSNSPYLQFANNSKGLSAAASPFVALMREAGIEALSGALNGAILIFIISSASSDLYICGRTMYGLGKQGSLFKCFAWSNRW